jgi:hypothetical protein
MKKIFFLPLIFFTLAACGGPSLKDQVDMSVSLEPKNIVVSRENAFKKTVKISWEITNRSPEPLEKEKYSLSIGAARVGEASTEIYTTLEKSVAAGATEKGIHTKVFQAVQGASGDYELRFTLYEKLSGSSLGVVKQAVFPFTWTAP